MKPIGWPKRVGAVIKTLFAIGTKNIVFDLVVRVELIVRLKITGASPSDF